MDFFEVVNARRSVRKYLPDAVPREVLDKIVAAAIEAPSGCNLQLRHYVLVDDPAVLDGLREVSPALTGAPAAIVVLMEPTGTKYGEFWVQDSSAAIENMLLAAVALGYASCWVEGQVRRHEPALRKLLAVPDNLRVQAILPVGRPAVHPDRPLKPAPGDVTHHNRFGETADK